MIILKIETFVLKSIFFASFKNTQKTLDTRLVYTPQLSTTSLQLTLLPLTLPFEVKVTTVSGKRHAATPRQL